MLKKQLLKDKDAAHHFQLVQGRDHAVKFWSADGQLSNNIINVHNLGPSGEDLNVIRTFARDAMMSTRALPTNHHIWLLGKLRFDAPREEPCKINDWAFRSLGRGCRQTRLLPHFFAGVDHARRQERTLLYGGREVQLWEEILGQMVEVADAAPSHFDAGVMCTSRIDRIFSSLHGWQMSALNVEPGPTKDPIRWHGSG